MRLLGATNPAAQSWMWGLNGALGVMGTLASTMIAMTVGHSTLGELVGGRTLGKALVGARVVTGDGSRPSPVAVLARNGLKALVLLIPLLAVFALLNPHAQGLGDLVARTVVVRIAADRSATPPRDRYSPRLPSGSTLSNAEVGLTARSISDATADGFAGEADRPTWPDRTVVRPLRGSQVADDQHTKREGAIAAHDDASGAVPAKDDAVDWSSWSNLWQIPAIVVSAAVILLGVRTLAEGAYRGYLTTAVVALLVVTGALAIHAIGAWLHDGWRRWQAGRVEKRAAEEQRPTEPPAPQPAPE